jgi:tRNA nucleotidyltransferase/poly(A) polymerase
MNVDALKKFVRQNRACEWTQTLQANFPDAEIFFVGGAVRDVLLKRDTTDFDFVVRGVQRTPLESWFTEHGTVELVGTRFGVYKFLPSHADVSEPLDIALPRSEHPIPGSMGGYREFDLQIDPLLPIEKDLARRDFTINALAYSLKTWTLVDPFGGVHDLETQIIRAVGDARERFSEDLSRLLRAIRFAAQLHFEIEELTWKALVEKMPSIHSKRHLADGSEAFVVPRETIGRELGKALAADSERTALLLERAGAIQTLFPEVMAYLAVPLHDHLMPLKSVGGDVRVAVSLLLRNVPSEKIAETLRAVGLTTIDRHEAARIESSDIRWIVERLQYAEANMQPAVRAPAAQFERTFMNARGKALLLALQALDRSELAQMAQERIRAILAQCPRHHEGQIPALVSGSDILALGVAPGPRVRELLEAVRTEQLEGRLHSPEEAITWLKKQEASH